MLVSWSVLPDAKPKRKPVKYRLRWVQTQNSGVGLVHFMFFVLISFALGSQCEPSFQWNMGLKGCHSLNVVSYLEGDTQCCKATAFPF